MRTTLYMRTALGISAFIVFLAAWQLLASLHIAQLQYAIPTVGETARAIISDGASGQLGINTWVTVEETLLGLAIAVAAAVGLGVAIGLLPLVDAALYPLVVFFQGMPKVALAPLWLIIFGFGTGSKVAMAAMIAFFPILVGVVSGMKSARKEEIELMLSLNATRWQIFNTVRLPRAIPATFDGFEVGATFALLGAVVGELVGAQAGLGFLISFRSQRLDAAGVFSPLVVLSLIGVVMNVCLRFAGRRLGALQQEV